MQADHGRHAPLQARNGQGGLSDACAYLYCCTVSACKADGVEFSMSLMEFADSLAPDDLTEWAEAVNATAANAPGDDGDGEKKS